jgi:hypothetical protein
MGFLFVIFIFLDIILYFNGDIMGRQRGCIDKFYIPPNEFDKKLIKKTIDVIHDHYGSLLSASFSLDISSATLYQWSNLKSFPNPYQAIWIEKKMAGEVRREELCPQVFKR